MKRSKPSPSTPSIHLTPLQESTTTASITTAKGRAAKGLWKGTTAPLPSVLDQAIANFKVSELIKAGKAEFVKEEDEGIKPSSIEDATNPDLFQYTNNLLHRVTGRYLPASVLHDGVTQAKEIAHLYKDSELVLVIHSVQVVAQQFKEIAKAVLSHRKELGHLLIKLESTYLSLFEKLLETSFRFYYQYRRQHQHQMEHNENTIQELQVTVVQHEESIRVLTHHVEAKEILIKTQQIQIEAYEKRIQQYQEMEQNQAALDDELRELKRYRFDQEQRTIEFLAMETRLQDREDKILQNQHLAEMQLKAERKKIVDDAKHFHEVFSTSHDEMNDKYSKAFRPKQHNAMTQTECDDDGLWDVKDCIPVYVSANIWTKILWRRFDGFVRCKNCHGRPLQDTEAFQDKDEYVELWSLGKYKAKRASKGDSLVDAFWRIPATLRTFLSNIPKTAVGASLIELSTLLQTIDVIYDAKFLADVSDENDRIGTQSLLEFLMEYYLEMGPGRQQAEVALYQFLLSIKFQYSASSVIRLFTRFLGLLENTTPPTVASSKSSVKGAYTTSATATTTQSQKMKSQAVIAIPSWNTIATASAATTTTSTTSESGEADKAKSSLSKTGTLNQSYLRVYLHARYKCLHHPILGESHVVAMDPLSPLYLPLDYGIACLKYYTQDVIVESKVRGYCRQLEYNSAVYDGKSFIETKGNRLAVRAHMRHAMLNNNGNTSNSNSSKYNSGSLEDKHVKMEPRVVVSIVLVLDLIVEVLQLRSKLIQDELIESFKTADINHDCVLSFTEFRTMLKPRLSQDFSERQLLRMFREALTYGHEQSFAITSDAFLHVCSTHGLVSLVSNTILYNPLRELEPPHQLIEAEKVHVDKLTKMNTAIQILLGQSDSINDSNQKEEKEAAMAIVVSTAATTNTALDDLNLIAQDDIQEEIQYEPQPTTAVYKGGTIHVVNIADSAEDEEQTEQELIQEDIVL